MKKELLLWGKGILNQEIPVPSSPAFYRILFQVTVEIKVIKLVIH